MADDWKVGFLGLGAMGLGMASCLVRAGFKVTGFDVNTKAVERFVGEGGNAAHTPRAAAAEADLLAIVVATSDQTSSVLFDQGTGALASLPQTSVILLCITCAPGYVLDLRRRLDAAGRSDLRLIDCPISGGEVRAWQGNLTLLCAGNESDVEYIRDVLECLGSQLHILPGSIGAGSSVKMVHQILVGVHILASVEVMGLAYVEGLDLQSTYDSVMKGEGASWLFGQRAAHILGEDKVPASSLMVIAKDFAMLNASAQRNKVSLPLASLAHQLFVQTSSAGWGTTDDCTVINTYLIGRAQVENLRDLSKRTNSRHTLNEAAITNLLIGIHAAAAVEALKFAKTLGIDPAVVRAVVEDAAGSSVMFDRVCADIQLKSQVSLKSIGDFDIILENLTVAIEAAKSAHYPLFFASTAQQQFYSS